MPLHILTIESCLVSGRYKGNSALDFRFSKVTGSIIQEPTERSLAVLPKRRSRAGRYNIQKKLEDVINDQCYVDGSVLRLVEQRDLPRTDCGRLACSVLDGNYM